MSVILETTMGDVTIDLYVEDRRRTCLNFLKLCKIKYYNYCLFHTVQRKFLIQAGDPTGTGRGGESIFGMLYGDQAKYFEPETVPKLKHRKTGTISMVNNGNNMHGSQFFITTSEDLDYLDGVHTVFGEVTEGFEVLMKINDSICDENHRPFKDIRLSHTVIVDDPFDDPAGLDVPPQSPEPSKELLESERIGAHEDLDDGKGRTIEEIEEEIEGKEAKARATILEMVGDLPDADVKPPETVLFVCKLNPVTTDEDLEIIFSRFGTIVSCEVIRDKKTGDSLQYAFIEFEKEEDCENAYFKMDNVLIDDRRIHVDFSQSVSKLKWKGKGKGVEEIKDEKEKLKYTIKNPNRSTGSYSMVFEGDDTELVARKRKEKSRSPSPKETNRHGSRKDSRSKDKSRHSSHRGHSPSSDYRRKKSNRSRSQSRYEEESKRRPKKTHRS